MSTAPTNAMILTPLMGVVRPRIYAGVIGIAYDAPVSRSSPDQIGGTSRRGPSAKPVSPTERPADLTRTAEPLEPARAPVPGAIPSATSRLE